MKQQSFSVFLSKLMFRFNRIVLSAWKFNNRRTLEDIGHLLNLHRAKPVTQLLPSVLYERIISDETSIKLCSMKNVIGNISIYELIIICKLIREKNPKIIFEIGTYDGRTSLNMAANAEDAIVYTLDLPKHQIDTTKLEIEEEDKAYIQKDVSGSCFRGTPYEAKIMQLYGDSGNFEYGQWLKKVDFVFIDGSHAYTYIMNDAQVALNLVKSDGIILFHDYGIWTGVTLALNELYLKDKKFMKLRHIDGTSFAILDFCKGT